MAAFQEFSFRLLMVLVVLLLKPLNTFQENTEVHANEKECILEPNPQTRTFLSLQEYQSTKISFSPTHSNFEGNYVNFSFITLDEIPKNGFISFNSDSIIKLELNHKEIQKIDDHAFLGLFCLHYLELKGNKISTLTEETFTDLVNVRELTLEGNKITKLDSSTFFSMKELKILNLSRNSIKIIKKYAFYNLNKLEKLDLSRNLLRFTTSGIFSSLANLKSLFLDHNYLYDMRQEDYTGLTNLETLDLASNVLVRFDISATFPFSFSRLKKLNLSLNSLSNLNVKGLRNNFPYLKSIDIHGNSWYCEDLNVIQHGLLDLNIVELGPNVSCIGVGSTYPSRKETSSAPTALTIAPKKSTVESGELKNIFLNKHKEISDDNKILLQNVNHLESMMTFMLTVILIFIIVHISASLGVCHFLKTVFNGSRVESVSEERIENMSLLQRS